MVDGLRFGATGTSRENRTNMTSTQLIRTSSRVYLACYTDHGMKASLRRLSNWSEPALVAMALSVLYLTGHRPVKSSDRPVLSGGIGSQR
jgi:hypothetical protein